MLNFAITGVAGYIAPRHLQAIHDTGNRLVAAVDPHDSVGILDRWHAGVAFFTEFERFDRHLELMRRRDAGNRVEWLSICAPNHLHDAHVRLALRVGANALCEKPLVLNPWNLDALAELERESSSRVFTVLQLRVHPALVALQQKLAAEPHGRGHEVRLTYVTGRGPWYRYSWKGDPQRSGGIATNIGIHFFDMLIWLFGPAVSQQVHLASDSQAAGFLELERAQVSWFLSIDAADLPRPPAPGEPATHRSVTVDGEEIGFSGGFADLHTLVYRETVAGRGFGIEDARPAIELAHRIRHAPPVRPTGPHHPMVDAVGR